MYGKLFSSMYDGTLGTRGPWQALVTFQQLIILADKEGVVDMTASAISRRTTIPLKIIDEGIKSLMEPDPDSRSPDEAGRRIVLLYNTRNWGWRIVNYIHYRNLRSAEERREYHRQYYHTNRKQSLTNDSTISTISTDSTKAVSSKQKAEETYVEAKASPCPFVDIINLYHKMLPTLARVEKLTPARKSYIKQRWTEDLPTLEQWENYFAFVAKSNFLMGKTNGHGDRPPFKATLEWLTKASNFAKVAEDKYHG